MVETRAYTEGMSEFIAYRCSSISVIIITDSSFNDLIETPFGSDWRLAGSWVRSDELKNSLIEVTLSMNDSVGIIRMCIYFTNTFHGIILMFKVKFKLCPVWYLDIGSKEHHQTVSFVLIVRSELRTDVSA